MTIMSARDALRHILGDDGLGRVTKLLKRDELEAPCDLRWPDEADFGIDVNEVIDCAVSAARDEIAAEYAAEYAARSEFDIETMVDDTGERVWLHRDRFLDYVHDLQRSLSSTLSDEAEAVGEVLRVDVAHRIRSGDYRGAGDVLHLVFDDLRNLASSVNLLTTEHSIDEAQSVDQVPEGLARLLAALAAVQRQGASNGDDAGVDIGVDIGVNIDDNEDAESVLIRGGASPTD